MSDDLVKRLRDKNCCDATKCNCDEAADSIESWKAGFQLANERWAEAQDRVEVLEKALRLAAGYISAQVEHWHDKNPHDVLAWLIECAEEDTRAALGEKKDG